MQISPIQFQYNKFAFNNRRQSDSQSQISFKQVTPEHFFIKMSGYEKDYKWGTFISELVNKGKNKVLKPDSTIFENIVSFATKYNKFMSNTQDTFGRSFGAVKGIQHKDLHISFVEGGKYGEYYRTCKRILKNNSKELKSRVVLNKEYNTSKKFKAYQVQDEIGGQKVVLTQIGKRDDKLCKALFSNYIYLIHPPYQTSEVLIPKAQKYLDELKPYKKKKLKAEDINVIYEKIGAIHWCLAQGMPFQRGSAALADVYTKSLFESLNIQTTPWKAGLAPDWEAFITPLDEYSKKYRTFFEL